MTDLDERIYYSEEQFKPILTVYSGRPPEFLNDDGKLAAERQLPDLGLMGPLGWHWGLSVLATCSKWKPDVLF